MKFLHPSILYALGLLLIPVLVHLLRLQRFKIFPFPNVAFLQNVRKESRRTRNLKKRLLLLSRLLLLTFLILAFARPVIPVKQSTRTGKNIIFFDNSLSTSYRKSDRTVKQILLNLLNKSIRPKSQYRLFTNGHMQGILTAGKFLAKKIDKEYYPGITDHQKILKLLTENDSIPANIFYFTDGQFLSRQIVASLEKDTGTVFHFILYHPQYPLNLRVDTLYIYMHTPDQTEMEAILKNSSPDIHTSISIYADNSLIYKNIIEKKDQNIDTIRFKIDNHAGALGRIVISDDGAFPLDNTFYYHIPFVHVHQVLVISDTIPAFIKNLFPKTDFSIQKRIPDKIPWAELDKFDLIILYGWHDFFSRSTLTKTGVPIVIIPRNSDDYPSLLQAFGQAVIDTARHQISRINTAHPFFRDVIGKLPRKVRFPYSNRIYRLPSQPHTLIATEDNRPFYFRYKNLYIFTGEITAPHSDFYLSPLVVPCLIKPVFARQSKEKLYQYIDNPDPIRIKTVLKDDIPVKLVSGNDEIIPYSDYENGFLTLYTKNIITRPGNYAIIHGRDTLGFVSFNYNRRESDLTYFNSGTKTPGNVYIHENGYANLIPPGNKPVDLTRLFLILALVFMFIELLIIKKMP